MNIKEICEPLIGENKEKGPKVGPLTLMIAAHFSATSDVRACNLNMPQSQ